MKNFVMTIMLFVTYSLSAKTPTSDMSWDELIANRSLDIKFPAARMNHGPATGVDFLCLDGEVLRTKKMLEKCVKYVTTPGRNGELKCVKSVLEFGIVNRQEESTRCVQYSRNRDSMECIKYEDYTYIQPLTFNVDVFRFSNPKKSNSVKIFTKKFEVSDCQ